MTAVRTVLGDIQASELGITYAHEHLVLDSPVIAASYPHILLDDVDIAVREVQRCRDAGVRTMVDAMPSAGRQVERLAAISRATGMHVIAATGLHHERYYGPGHWTAQVSVEQLAALFIADITEGVDAFDYTGPILRRTEHRAGVIKIASSGGALGDRDRRLAEAAAVTHVATGAPILTHCENGHGALEQIEALTELGVPADAIMLSHIDKVTDLAYHLAIADAGAWLLFDQALRQSDERAPGSATLIAQLARAGHTDRILLGTDGARRDLWTGYGGSPGLAWLASDYPGVMRHSGVDDDVVTAIFVTNPARALILRLRKIT